MHLSFDIETPLHQKLVGESCKLYVVIDGDALIKDGLVQPSNLDSTAFSDLLRSKRPQLEMGDMLLFIRVTSNVKPHKAAREFVGMAAQGIAVEAGIPSKKVLLGESFEIQIWDKKINAANNHLTGIQPGNETPIIHDACIIFPIQTNFSSWLTDNADCIVFIKTRVTQPDSDVIPFAVRQTVERSLDNLKLQHRKRIMFDLESSGDGRSAVDQFIENERHQEIAKSLGFETGVIRVH